jgi:CubicO group peptidase (beta-lactamase class C family)
MKPFHLAVISPIFTLAVAACSSPSSSSAAAPCPSAPAIDAGVDRPTPVLPLDLPTQSDIAATVQPLVEEGYMNGFVVGFIDATGEVVYGYGKTGAGGVPDGDTVYEIGSVTKSFTSLWLATQMATGMKLEDPVAGYLPQGVVVPTRNGKSITLGQLSTHTSGLPRLPTNLAPADWNDPYADYLVKDLYAFLGSYTLKVDPGSTYAYSNVGAGLLGHVLTRHAGGTYESNIASVIGAPLGLVDTSVTLNETQKTRLAPGHDGDLGAAKGWSATNAIEGAGQLHSTAHDLLKLVSAEIGLSGASLAPAIALTQTKHATDELRRATGLGWVLEADGRIWNNGQTGGYTSFVGFDPKEQHGVVVIADTASRYTTELGMALLERLRGRTVKVALPPSIAMTDAELGAFVGTYALPDGPMVVALKGHVLWATGILDTATKLYPASATTFSLRRIGGTVGFSTQSATLAIDGAASVTGPKR